MGNIEVIKRQKTTFEKIVSGIVSIFCAFVVLVCAVVCIATLNCKMQNMVSSVGGYSAVTIAPTGSMRNSGFEAWDIVLVKKVNARSLIGDQYNEEGELIRRGDIIAYYRYYDTAKSSKCPSMDLYTSAMASGEKESVSLSLKEFFGSQNETITKAAQRDSKMVFHHIKEVRQDEDGKLYFRTYGSSNLTDDGKILEDGYWISEDVIIGKYYEEGNPILLSVFQIFASQAGIITLICIPMVVLFLMVLLDVMKGLELANIEDKVLKGKLHLTDPVCIVNNIGFNMSKQTKFKVLAQLTPQERIEAVSYLWQSPKDIQHMKKYYIKQKLLMHYDEERLALKNEYAQILSDKKANATKLKEYQRKLDDIEKREEKTIKQLKEISKRANAEKQAEGYRTIDQMYNLKNAKVKLKKGEHLHIGPHKSKEAKSIVQNLEKHIAKLSVDNNLSNKDINESVETFQSSQKKSTKSGDK